jgi:hypothetical protein
LILQTFLDSSVFQFTCTNTFQSHNLHSHLPVYSKWARTRVSLLVSFSSFYFSRLPCFAALEPAIIHWNCDVLSYLHLRRRPVNDGWIWRGEECSYSPALFSTSTHTLVAKDSWYRNRCISSSHFKHHSNRCLPFPRARPKQNDELRYLLPPHYH